MSHTFCKIWIHGIWTTKYREEAIIMNKEEPIYSIMYNEFKEAGYSSRIINGMPDHIHSLFLLNPAKAPSEVIKLVKGLSSHEINSSNLLPGKFSWQSGFSAFSVSESQVERVYNYIRNQKQHHREKSFIQELNELTKLCGIPNE